MQKFRENNQDTMYEDVLMPPGFTHDPFFTVGEDRSFNYPWHRYYADSGLHLDGGRTASAVIPS